MLCAMWRRPALAVSAVLVCACGSSAARPATGSGTTGGAASGSPPPSQRCGPAGAATLAADGAGRVYVRGGSVIACSSRSGRHYVLGSHGSCLGGRTRVAPVAVAGPLVAYGTRTCGVDTSQSAVHVRRLSDGSALRTLTASTSIRRPESFVSVTALVLARDGAVAWIAVGGSILGGTRFTEVHAFTGGRARVLDRGAGVDPKLLRLAGGVVRWRHGGAWRSARLA